ncbi:sulfurtransferase TusA family protein [Anaeromicrobium sediminis]|nr:sulfurtransferase TusA family protein [Anaeromicrobium sediminis]
MIELDVTGEFCPIPIIRIKAALKKSDVGEPIIITTDHSCVAQNISETFSKNTLSMTSEEIMNGIWEIIIKKV